jgi:hypothetical protein
MAESAKGFWTMIGLTILSGILWMFGSREMIKRIMGRKDE